MQALITKKQIHLIKNINQKIAEYTGLQKYQSWDEIKRLVNDRFFTDENETPCDLKGITRKKADTLINFMVNYKKAVTSGREEEIEKFWKNEGYILRAADKSGSTIYEGDLLKCSALT